MLQPHKAAAAQVWMSVKACERDYILSAVLSMLLLHVMKIVHIQQLTERLQHHATTKHCVFFPPDTVRLL